MKLPVSLASEKEWSLIGPMGPEVPQGLLAYPILCVDGGARFTHKIDVWIGDGDSGSIPVKCENIYQFSPHKSESDLFLALSLLKDTTHMTLHCWGFLGGRRDHELINMGVMMTFLEGKSKSEAIFYDLNAKVAIRAFGSGFRELNHQGLFSLASLKNVRVKMTGECAYQLNEMTELTPLSSLGLSNVAQGRFNLENDGPVMVIFPEGE